MLPVFDIIPWYPQESPSRTPADSYIQGYWSPLYKIVWYLHVIYTQSSLTVKKKKKLFRETSAHLLVHAPKGLQWLGLGWGSNLELGIQSRSPMQVAGTKRLHQDLPASCPLAGRWNRAEPLPNPHTLYIFKITMWMLCSYAILFCEWQYKCSVGFFSEYFWSEVIYVHEYGTHRSGELSCT